MEMLFGRTDFEIADLFEGDGDASEIAGKR